MSQKEEKAEETCEVSTTATNYKFNTLKT